MEYESSVWVNQYNIDPMGKNPRIIFGTSTRAHSCMCICHIKVLGVIISLNPPCVKKVSTATATGIQLHTEKSTFIHEVAINVRFDHNSNTR